MKTDRKVGVGWSDREDRERECVFREDEQFVDWICHQSSFSMVPQRYSPA